MLCRTCPPPETGPSPLPTPPRDANVLWGSQEPSLSVCTFSFKPVFHIPAHVYQDRQEKPRMFQFLKPTPPGDIKAAPGLCGGIPTLVAVLPLCFPGAPAAPPSSAWMLEELSGNAPLPCSSLNTHPGHDPHLKAPQHPKLHETLAPTL